ncbi:MAG: hypothetical protein WCJ61_05890 [Paludibacter sp.]
MKKDWIEFISKKEIQIVIYLIINSLFVLKYTPRYNLNPYLSLVVYFGLVYAAYFIYRKVSTFGTEKLFKILYWTSLILAVGAISISLIYIDRYTIRVDRWSALTFFWDAAFNGHYPYGAHTHVSATNFPSPFPVWHLIGLPFYLLGDVGYQIIFFLILFAFVIKCYFSSYKKSFFFLMLLLISPSYWWEVIVRSDSFSNSLLVFMIICLFVKYKRDLSNSFVLIIFICGAIASTRFTAILPLTLFLFQPYLHLTIKKKIIFPITILGIAFLSFLPFIFWDTSTWIFFKRNPFMSQTGNGNFYLLLLMIILGIIMALRWRDIQQFFSITSIFIFIFILSSQIVYLESKGNANFFSDGIVDISYFNLALPYCLARLTSSLRF